MPRNKISYKPVRYISRKKVYSSSYSKKQYKGKEVNLKKNQNYRENIGQTSQMPEKGMHPYPLNNIVVLPQNSDALNNVNSQGKHDFSNNRYFRRKAKGRSNSYSRNTLDTDCDVKPDINEIKFKNLNNSNVNRHTIILSDSEDDIIFEGTMNSEKKSHNCDDLCPENVNEKAEKNEECSLSADDDVILVENEAANDIIEIDDNMEQDIPEVNDNASGTPESSASNDFLENSQLNQNPNFNFSLHGSEFKDSEFLRPSVNIDISESGSISSISDISSSLKTNVFNLVDFPKEKDNLFDENNLEKFKNSITPQRLIKNAIVDDHSNLMGKSDKYSKKELPTLSDIGTDYKKPKRVRGRSVIRELVNDRAYVLLSSAEKKMKAKKRKSKDCVNNSLNETDLTETISLETSKKKKRKKIRKKEASLIGETDSYLDFTGNNFSTSSLETNTSKQKNYELLESQSASENCENHPNMDSNKVMIRTDLFTDLDANTYSKTENTNSGVVLEQSEITSKQKQKRHQSVQVVDSNDVRKRNKKDKLLTGYSETEECEHIALKKSDKVGKKNIQYKNEGQFELKDEVNSSFIERKRKRKKDQKLSEGEIVDGADSEISKEACSISKHKPKKKRLSENYETESCLPTEVDSTICEVNIETPEKFIRQNTHSNIEIPSEVLHIQEDLAPFTNIDEPSFLTCTDHGQKVDATELYIIESKPMSKEPNTITKISPLKHTVDVIEFSPSLHGVESNIELGDNKAINKLDFVHNFNKPITYTGTPSSADNNCTDSKGSIRTVVRNIENSEQILDGIGGEYSCIEKNICIKESLEKDCPTAETSYAVCKVSETLSASDKLLTKKLLENEVLHSIENSSGSSSQMTTFLHVPLSTQVKMEDLSHNSLHVNNQTNNIDLDEENKNSEVLHIEKDGDNLTDYIVKNEPQKIENIGCKETQEFKVGSTEANSPLVSEVQECDLGVSGIKEKLPDVIDKIISKKDPITSMRKLCEYLEEVNDPQDILKKVSMIKEAFLAKSVDAAVKSPSVVEEVVSEDDVLSVSSESSSVLCIESDGSDIDLIDNLTLINCELSTPVKEVGKNNKGIEEKTFVSNKSCSDKDQNVTKNKDIFYDIRRHETGSVLHSREVGNHERGLDKYNVEDIQFFMSDDQKLWEISSEDLTQKQFVPKGKRCVKCKEIGHLGYNCPNKLNLPKCILCGVAGHLDFKCPNKICIQCGRKSSIMKNTCQYCKHYRSSTCSLCKMRGHPRNKCPDLWRRYHLTEDQERPLNPEGMILNEKENQHYSDAACLEQSCSLIQKNTNIQELHTTLEQCVEVNNQNENTRSSSTNTLNEENKVDEANNYCCSSEKKVGNRKCDCTELQPLIHTLPENFATVDSFAPSSPVEDVRRFENEIFVEIHSETRQEPIQLEKMNSEIQKDSNQFEETNNTIAKYTDSDSLKFTDTTELTENARASSFNFTLNSKCTLSSNKIHFDSNNLEVFNASEQSQKDCLKMFLTYELNVLKNTRFQVKQLIHKYLAYKKDKKKSSRKRKFPLQKVQNFNKTLNMVLFGRAYFKEGRTHYKRLEDFVNGSLPSEFVGEPLQNSYEYLFGAKRHADVNYLSLIKLLLKQQTTEISNTSEITNKKVYSTNSQVNNPNANSTESKTSRLKIDSPKKSDRWKGQTQNDSYNNKKNKVSYDSVFDFDADPSSAHRSYTQITRPDIETLQEVTAEDVPTLCSNIEMESLLAGHCSKNHTYEPLDSIDLLSPSELIDVTAASNQFGKIECAIKTNTSITDSVFSSTNSEFAGKSEILANPKLNLKKAKSLKSTLKNKPVDSDGDIQDVFNKSDIEFLKNYINDDLELLSTTRFNVKRLFHRFIAFKKDECNPISERQIALNLIQTLNKTLNMMFFGKAHFKQGGVHYRKLVAFVNKGIHSTSLRESLFKSYTYIFSGTRHANVEDGPLVKPQGNLKLKNKENLWCSFCAKSGHLYHYCFSAKRHQNFHPIDPSIRNYIDVYCAEECVNNDVRLHDKNRSITSDKAPQNTPKNTTSHKSVVLRGEEMKSKNTVQDSDREASKNIPKNSAKSIRSSVGLGSEETTSDNILHGRDSDASESITKNRAKNIPQNITKNTTLHKSVSLGSEETTADNILHGRDSEASESITKNRAKNIPQNITKNTTIHKSVSLGSEETTADNILHGRDSEGSESITKNRAKNIPQNITKNTTLHKSVSLGSEETTADNILHGRDSEASESITKNTAKNIPQNITKNTTHHKSVVLGSEEKTVKNIVHGRYCETNKSIPKNSEKNTPQNIIKNRTPHKSIVLGTEEITAKNTVHGGDYEDSESMPKNSAKYTPQNISKNRTPHKTVVLGCQEITSKDFVDDRDCKSINKSTSNNTQQNISKNMRSHKSVDLGTEEITAKNTVHGADYEDSKSISNNTPQNISKNGTQQKSLVADSEEITAKDSIHDRGCEVGNSYIEDRSSSSELLPVDVNTASRPNSDQSHIPIKETTAYESTRNSFTPLVHASIEGLPPDFYVIDELVNNSESEASVTAPNDAMQIDNGRKTESTENIASSIKKVSSDINDSKELNSKSDVTLINSEYCFSDVNLSKDLHHKSKSSESQIEPEMASLDSNFDVVNFFLISDVNTLKSYLRTELSVLQGSSFKVKNYYYRLLAYKEDSIKPEHEWKISLAKKQNLYKEINMMLFGREQLKAGRFHYAELAKFVKTASGFITKHFRESLYSSYEYIFSNALHRHVNYEQLIEILMRKYSNRTI